MVRRTLRCVRASRRRLADGTLTQISDDTYRLDWYGGELITVADMGTYLDWTVALGPHDDPGSVRGLLGSNTGQTTMISSCMTARCLLSR